MVASYLADDYCKHLEIEKGGQPAGDRAFLNKFWVCWLHRMLISCTKAFHMVVQ